MLQFPFCAPESVDAHRLEKFEPITPQTPSRGDGTICFYAVE